MGLIDIKGAPRVSFSGEKFQRNGDAVREVREVYPLMYFPKASNNFDMGYADASLNVGN